MENDQLNGMEGPGVLDIPPISQGEHQDFEFGEPNDFSWLQTWPSEMSGAMEWSAQFLNPGLIPAYDQASQIEPNVQS